MQFEEYPKVMRHPQYRPAVVAQWDPKIKDPSKQPQGSPAKFPEVQVNTRDQELQYASLGYLPGGISDPQAYMRAVMGADAPSGYGFVEFPKWIYQVVDDELESKLVNSKAEQDKLGNGWYSTPDRAWQADAGEIEGSGHYDPLEPLEPVHASPKAAAKTRGRPKKKAVKAKRPYHRKAPVDVAPAAEPAAPAA